MGRALMSAESWSNSRVCAGLHSAPVRRSFDKEIGATRVDVVIFSPCRRIGNPPRISGLRGIRSGSLLRSFCKNKFKESQEFAHLRASDDKGRQQTQRKIVGTVDEQAALHGFADERRAFHREFDANHQAFAANFADEAKFCCKLYKPVAQLCASRADIFEEFFALDDLEKLEGHSTSQRAAAESSAMHPGRNARGDCFRGENRAEWKSGGKRLSNQNDIRSRRKFLISEIAAGAAKPALNLIGDQESAVLRSQGAGTTPEFFADSIDSAFSLQRFQKDGANGIVEFRLKISDVVEPDEFRAWNDRRERQPILFRGGDADSTESASVKGILKGQEAVFFRNRPGSFIRLASTEARQLHCAIDGFRAAVGKKDAIHARPSGEFAREWALIGIVIEIGEMNGAGGFT